MKLAVSSEDSFRDALIGAFGLVLCIYEWRVYCQNYIVAAKLALRFELTKYGPKHTSVDIF